MNLQASAKTVKREEGLFSRTHPRRRAFAWVVALAVSALIVVSRRPDYVLHANFWAEDGWRWYPDAYSLGWRSALLPWTGYYQTLSRLVAIFCQALPLTWAPTIFASVAILVQAVTAVFLLSDRLAAQCPRIAARAVLALFYLLLPNSFEVYANLTNAQWHLGLLAFLIVAGRAPSSLAGMVFDAVVLSLSALSGPLCLFVLPIALWRWATGNDRSTRFRLLIVLIGCAVQLSALLGTGTGRSSPPLGAGPRRFATILSMQVILPVLVGRHSTPLYVSDPLWTTGWPPTLIALIAIGLALRAIRTGPPIVALLCFFAGVVFGAALIKPAIGSTIPAWTLFCLPDVGDRYYLIPMVAWISVLLALTRDPWRGFHWTGRALLLLAFLMLPGDWHLPTSFPIGGRTDFVLRAREFERAPPGTTMHFPMHPQGLAEMVLTKR